MEMETNCADNQASETSTALEEDSSVLFGDQEMFPRVGDEYQAEILKGIQSTANDTPIEVLIGLPITVMWVEIEDKHSSSSTKGETGRKDCYLVPGSKEEGWSEIEEAGLLLGLYIFGKDFVKLKVFLTCKTMGSILSFYYGKFYKSDGYRRWSDCRKTKSRKIVLGQKIFSGFRLQELLSRLSLHASEERRNALSKVSDLFEEGKMRLDEFVFTIKAIVGMKNFVEAISIGKGKQDLTGMISEPPKANNSVGKACSSLTTSEIVKLLTGDIRLSKARSNDLFWEAIWPRLLARGWHSEQPKCYAAVSKQPLVFLVPGYTKFSRRRLVKDDHYFDSITDVLHKVASEPTLIELEADESNENDKKLEPDNSSDHQRQSYLQPRTSNQNGDLLKFTVVDTSHTSDGKPFSTRQLRMLSDESINVITDSPSPSSEDSNSSTDDIILNNSSNSSVAIKKHKRRQVSQKEATEGNVLDSSFNVDQSYNQSEPRELIDLNYPLLPPGFEPCDIFMMETVAQPSPQEEQTINVNGRRQSTRYRPPTVKVLEALADGLLTSGIKKDKNRAGRCRENSRSRSNS
ncbi:uncharacterized protein LOC124920832 [Impatiens glandulifera]|uniref:uncharacterized protein LOC124920832 n=1 Tax=Impatiens glandulifera TaxID=253017 RepID=UPI001FB1865A|nr:uncharacterized protein LOC124920832 [Impatiens glandulifera]